MLTVACLLPGKMIVGTLMQSDIPMRLRENAFLQVLNPYTRRFTRLKIKWLSVHNFLPCLSHKLAYIILDSVPHCSADVQCSGSPQCRVCLSGGWQHWPSAPIPCPRGYFVCHLEPWDLSQTLPNKKLK